MKLRMLKVLNKIALFFSFVSISGASRFFHYQENISEEFKAEIKKEFRK